MATSGATGKNVSVWSNLGLVPAVGEHRAPSSSTSPSMNFIPLVSLLGTPSSSEKRKRPDFLTAQPEQLSRKAAHTSLLLSAASAQNPASYQHPGARFQLPRGTHGCLGAAGGGNGSSKGSGRLLSAYLRPLLFGERRDEDFVFLCICTALNP